MTWLSFLENCFFFSVIFVHLLNLLRAIITISTICVRHLSWTKYPCESIFCDVSGFVLFVSKSWAIQNFEVLLPLVGCDFPQARDDLVTSLHVWTRQPAIAKWATCTGLSLPLKYPVNVSKSLCTHKMWLLSSWFVYLTAPCLLQTKISRAGTSACAAGLDFAGNVSAQQMQPYHYHRSVKCDPLVPWDGCGPIHLPVAWHQSLSVPGYCAVRAVPSSSITKTTRVAVWVLTCANSYEQ